MYDTLLNKILETPAVRGPMTRYNILFKNHQKLQFSADCFYHSTEDNYIVFERENVELCRFKNEEILGIVSNHQKVYLDHLREFEELNVYDLMTDEEKADEVAGLK